MSASANIVHLPPLSAAPVVTLAEGGTKSGTNSCYSNVSSVSGLSYFILPFVLMSFFDIAASVPFFFPKISERAYSYSSYAFSNAVRETWHACPGFRRGGAP